MLANRLDQNDDGFPQPVTDPVVREAILAAMQLRVHEAQMEAMAQLAGLLPPPPTTRAAAVLRRRASLHGRHAGLHRLPPRAAHQAA